MPPKRQRAHIKELAQKKKREAEKDAVSVVFEDESTEGSWVPENDTLEYRDFDWERDSASEDDVEMTDDDEKILDVNAFDILMKAAQDSSNFENHKLSYVRGPELSKQQKRKLAGDKREQAALAHGCQSLTAGFLITKASEISKTPAKPDPSSLLFFFP